MVAFIGVKNAFEFRFRIGREVMVEHDQVPMFFSVFSIFVDIEDLDFFAVVFTMAVLAKSFFEFLNVGVIESVVIAGFCFVVSKCEETIITIEGSMKYATSSQFSRASFSTENAFATVIHLVVDKFEAGSREREVTKFPGFTIVVT